MCRKLPRRNVNEQSKEVLRNTNCNDGNNGNQRKSSNQRQNNISPVSSHHLIYIIYFIRVLTSQTRFRRATIDFITDGWLRGNGPSLIIRDKVQQQFRMVSIVERAALFAALIRISPDNAATLRNLPTLLLICVTHYCNLFEFWLYKLLESP